MFVQPGPHVGVFVGGVFFQDQVHGQFCRDVLLNCFEEGQELAVAVFGQAGTDHLGGGDIQGRKGVVVPLRL